MTALTFVLRHTVFSCILCIRNALCVSAVNIMATMWNVEGVCDKFIVSIKFVEFWLCSENGNDSAILLHSS
jgi:lipid-A-disaccharide synthase-like uncharacterized protein